MSQFLPVNKKDMEERGWDQLDFVYVTGDAYVDHSSFGSAIISRLLESRGYKVGIIPQPDWRKKESVTVLRGAPSWLSGQRRQHGFHGEPLHRCPQASPEGFLFPRREDGTSPGPAP